MKSVGEGEVGSAVLVRGVVGSRSVTGNKEFGPSRVGYSRTGGVSVIGVRRVRDYWVWMDGRRGVVGDTTRPDKAMGTQEK